MAKLSIKPNAAQTKPLNPTAVTNETVAERPIFPAANYRLMAVGLVIVIIGFLLMMGGKNDDPTVFKPEDVYSFRRITLAPIVILLGLVFEIYAIMRRPKQEA
ncbi:DUF3098 domain-containing protein [Chitinophaga sp. Cy-1792]|uniref:DUF3098 domain-containing protein n=1 Tax=Chitinophaga sp. Cy-1792 TaxID=2608339 RepID=UPI00141ED5AF|nr:DUF3098 domain-containing protein [Chitinophaga sp. Cy-1792]NIG51936.1 DUF3098 domain-containing protein [Chitinophaga sp. Cy-1792]